MFPPDYYRWRESFTSLRRDPSSRQDSFHSVRPMIRDVAATREPLIFPRTRYPACVVTAMFVTSRRSRPPAQHVCPPLPPAITSPALPLYFLPCLFSFFLARSVARSTPAVSKFFTHICTQILCRNLRRAADSVFKRSEPDP